MKDLILYFEITDGDNKFGLSANLGPQREGIDYLEIAANVDKETMLRALCLDHISPSNVRVITAEEYVKLTDGDGEDGDE